MKRLDTNIFELLLSGLTLVLLFVFAIKGSGPLSADEYFRQGALQDRMSKKEAA